MNVKLEKAKLLYVKIKKSSETKLSSFQEFFNRKAPAVQINFRDLKNLNEMDAVNILKDIEILDLLDKEEL